MANQLSFPERIVIEKMIHQDYTFASIALILYNHVKSSIY